MRRPDLSRILAAARGDAPADLLIAGARVLCLFTHEILRTEVAITDGVVVGLGPHEAERVEELDGVLVPGLMDAHVHLESAMVTPREFARAVVPRGTTAVVTDAHEIANVHGAAGIEWILAATAELPLDVFLMLPSCVPATPLETSGAELRAADLLPFVGHPRVVGLGEVMNAPGAIHGDPDLLAKLEAVGGRVDGHAVGLSGHALDAYLAAGVQSDHETVTLEQGRERVRAGLHVMIRQGTTERNLDALLPLAMGPEVERCMFCTDDRHPHDLVQDGHMDDILRRAVSGGLDPITAIRLATRLPARYLGQHRRGAVAPGFRADLVLLEDLEGFRARRVWKDGRLVAADGELLVEPPPSPPPPGGFGRMVLPGPEAFELVDRGGEARVIEVSGEQILTRELRLRPSTRGGRVVADPDRDLLKLAVVERHHGTGRVGLGLVRGFGLRRGALASSVAHDSHNVVVVGVSDEDMAIAARAVADMGGGLCAAAGGEVLARLPLPVAGLMSDRPLLEVVDGLEAMLAVVRALGGRLHDPTMTLSFVALPPVPALRLSDRGLVDATRFRHVPLFVGDDPEEV